MYISRTLEVDDDGRLGLRCGADSTAVLALPGSRARLRVMKHPGAHRRFALSTDGPRVVAEHRDARLVVWELESGRELSAAPVHLGPDSLLSRSVGTARSC